MNTNENYSPEDFTVTVIEERDVKLKFAIWEQMEFLSEEMKIDDPKIIIDTVRNAVEQYFMEYSPMSEFFEEDDESD
ncbi:MAG: hypothetical protein HQ505_06850 [Nitrosopumilus sp.]|nr:hypothetical protein [Nitrosopumilus sp.]